MSNSLNLFKLIGVAIIFVTLVHWLIFVYRPSFWTYSCVQCTACDYAYIKT